MNAFLEQFNSKEYATLFYLIVIIGLLMLSKNLRSQFKNLIGILFEKAFLKIYLVVFSYVILSVLALKAVRIWDFTLLKDTLLWTFLIALPLVFQSNKIDSFDQFKKKVIIPLFKFSVIVEFIIGLYTFSLWIELLIFPIVVFFSILIAFSETKPEHRKAHQVFRWILNIVIIWVLYGIGKHLFSYYSEYITWAVFRQFLNPLCLSVLFLPVLYGYAMYFHYDSVLNSLKRSLKDSGNYSYAVRQAMFHFNSDLEGLVRWKNLMIVRHFQNKEEIREAIRQIKTLQKSERNPHTVNPELGWSPYLAKDFLKHRGIETPPYSNTYENEFYASSNYLKINDNLIEDTICYSVTGDQLIVRELHLSMRVFYGKKSLESRLIFLEFVKDLYFSANEELLPEQLEQAIEIGKTYKGETELAYVCLKKEIWKSKHNSYNLDFRIIHQQTLLA